MVRKRIQLGMLHVAVAMTLVPINSTLNRVMINELAISATLVAILASLPYFFSPIQVAIGSFADRHPLWGLRRTPYILFGIILCVLGVVVSPLVAFLLAENFWMGLGLGLLAFGAWGMGYNFASVSYLSLATEISGEKGRSKTIAVMFIMMITSIILTAVMLSRMLDPYSPQALVTAFWTVGLIALVLGLLGLVKLENRVKTGETTTTEGYSWVTLTRMVFDNSQAKLFFIYLIILLTAILGQDILLEPYGGEAFGMSVTETTRITSIWGGCFLVAMVVAGALEGRVKKRSVAQWGGWTAMFGFVLIAGSGFIVNQSIFYAGVVLLGFGTGLSTVSNLSLMLDMTTAGKIGLFIGAWGMASAASRLTGSVLGGMIRDVVAHISQNPVTGYVIVFGIEALMLIISLVMLSRINVDIFQRDVEQMSTMERAALANDA
jgi:BCD family chlorophyll transporter-like MFS transporter